MKIILAPNAGFCFGVRRAINMGEDAVKKYKEKIATFGPLIHNPQEVQRLNKMGITAREKLEEIKEKKILIRTHGVGPQVYKEAEKYGLQIIDCTCPYVNKVQKIACEYAEKGYIILILGNKDHPEVKGILGWSLGKGITFRNIEELKEISLDENNKYCLVAQTTENINKFNEVVNYLKTQIKDLMVFNTICSATRQRQESALKLVRDVDLMVVVGGLNSSNTQKLASICQKTGTPTKHIETSNDLKPEWFVGVKTVGVTAGASTPDWIIEEVIKGMEEIKNSQSEENVMENTLADKMTEMEEFKPGNVITGTVVMVKDDEVLVDVGGKSEGIIPLKELSVRNVSDPNEIVKVGDKVKVIILKVENSEGNMVLSKRRAEQEEALEKLEKAFQNNSIINGNVVEVVKGGLIVDVGMRGFVPASLIDISYVKDLEQFIGKNLKFKVIEFDKKEKKVVLSRKAVLEEELEAKKQKLWDELSEGQVRKGIVRRITNFGAFVDLGGIDGLLHVSEMGWGRVENPRDVVTEGDEIEVYILGVDKEKERISLGLKQLIPSPWEKAEEKYPVGSIVKGKVVRIAPFGAFVEIEPGIDGLVHISQLAWERVEKPEDVVSIGQEVEAKVLEFDKENKKISLSIKEAKDEKKKKKEEESYKLPQEEQSGVTLGDVFGDILDELKK